MADQATKLVILAAGKGTRMRRTADSSSLSDEQRAVARTGVKALMPVGRPFLDYVISRAADAGLTRVCLVVSPDHSRLRDYYSRVKVRRVALEFAVQYRPLGTAHALAVAERFVGSDPFLVLNSDNCYPTESLRALCHCDGPAVVGFDRDALAADSNLQLERIAAFAVIERNQSGQLRRIVEKPDVDQLQRFGPPVLVGMNCWRFAPSIFQSCRQISPSPRGEYEIPDAVSHSMQALGVRFQVIVSPGPVLDLSTQQDIAGVQEHLQGEEVQL